MERIVGRTKHGELTLDQIASLMPGMAELMMVVGQRYHVMYYAAKAENWDLAAYQLRGVRKAFNTAKLTRPKYGDAIDRFVADFIEPLDRALRDRDRDRFEQLVPASVAASDDLHREWGYAYIRYRIPETPPAGYALSGHSP